MTANPPLADRITKDIADAMRAKDQVRLAPLRMLKAALDDQEVEKGPLGGAESLQVVSSLIGRRVDRAISEGRASGSPTKSCARSRCSRPALRRPSMPPVERAVDEAIAETGAASAKDLGRVMKAVMPKLAGATVDGRAVNEIVRRKLERG